MLVTTLVFSKLTHFDPLVGVISICGALFIGYLAYENIAVQGVEISTRRLRPQSLKKGILTNFLNPHPYLFWCAVGAPTVIKALDLNLFSALLFIVSFYICIVGSKIVIASAVERSRSFIKNKLYIYTVRFFGVVLLVFSARFLWDGLLLLRIL